MRTGHKVVSFVKCHYSAPHKESWTCLDQQFFRKLQTILPVLHNNMLKPQSHRHKHLLQPVNLLNVPVFRTEVMIACTRCVCGTSVNFSSKNTSCTLLERVLHSFICNTNVLGNRDKNKKLVIFVILIEGLQKLGIWSKTPNSTKQFPIQLFPRLVLSSTLHVCLRG